MTKIIYIQLINLLINKRKRNYGSKKIPQRILYEMNPKNENDKHF